MLKITVAVALLAVGCSTTEEKHPPQPACSDLSITVDGEAIGPLSNAIGFREPKGGGYMVQLYDHDGVDCKAALSGHRVPRPHEVFARAYVGLTAHQTAVGLGDDTRTNVSATLMKRPQKAGDPIAICVRKPVTFKGTTGQWAGKQIEISGLFEASFCGMQHISN